MAKITEKYLRVPVGVILLLALFLCGMTVRPSAHARNLTPRTTWSAPANLPGRRIGQIKHWLAERYDGLRFVYQVEMQLSDLRNAELKRQRKAQSGSSHILDLETEPRP